MKKIVIGSALVALLIAACNDNSSPTRDERGNNNTANNDTSERIKAFEQSDMIVASNEVSEAEMRDDSVFTDGSIPTGWDIAGITDVRGLKIFLKNTQQWVMSNDKAQLALAVKYPLNNIKNKEEMMAAYDQVFTKDVKLSFAMINFNQIFRNSKGVMTAGGKAWITQEGNSFKIFAINP